MKIQNAAATILLLSIAACFGTLAWGIVQLVRTAEEIPVAIDTAVEREAAKLRSDLLAAAGQIEATASRESAAWRGSTLDLAAESMFVFDDRIGQAIGKSDKQITKLVDAAQGISEIRSDLKPLLAQSTRTLKAAEATMQNVNESLDDSYWDVKAMVESSTVASTQIAQSLVAIQPHIGPTVRSVEGIAKDANRIGEKTADFVDAALAPKPWYKKVWHLLWDGGMVAAKHIP